MSVSVSLQDVILAALRGNAGVAALVGDRIYDHAPEDAAFPHIDFGPSDYVPDDADCIAGRVEAQQIDVWSRDQGRGWPAKRLVDAVKAALHGHEADMATGALVSLEVTLCQVLDDPDGITKHGVVEVEALIEEA